MANSQYSKEGEGRPQPARAMVSEVDVYTSTRRVDFEDPVSRTGKNGYGSHSMAAKIG